MDDQLAEILENARPVSDLRDESGCEVLKQLDVVWGVDAHTDATGIFYGVKLLHRLAKGQAGLGLRVAAYKYGPSELSFFCSTVKRVKGSCDYSPDDLQSVPAKRTVRVYDFASKSTLEIPAEELAPGFVLGTVPDVQGPVYVKPSGEFKFMPAHQDLSDECKRVIRYFSSLTKDVDRRPFERHLELLLCERNFQKELYLNFCIARTYAYFSKSKIIERNARQSLFKVLVQCSFAEPHTALETLDLGSLALTKPSIQTIIAKFFEWDHEAEFARLFALDKLTAS